MKLQTAQRKIQRGFEATEQQFTIKATSKAFDILSSGLYSDKPRAIVRELSCNAYDAHIAAGKANVPIKIKLPNSLSPTLEVRDEGIGLSHNDVLSLYTTYFDSTKQDSNDFIGALGLGSKSPFSYTDAFTVESRFEGKKRLYSAFLNEDRIPAIVLLSEQDTDEPAGMTVSLNVRKEDCNQFVRAAQETFRYFSVYPEIVGAYVHQHQVKYVLEGSTWKVREDNDYNPRPQVVQGVVAYPLNKEQLVKHLPDSAQVMLSTPLDLYVPVGDVDVAASREALQYTKRTIANLTNHLLKAARELSVVIGKTVDEQPSEFLARREVIRLCKGNFRSIVRSLVGTGTIKWKGKNLERVELDFTEIVDTTVFVVSPTRTVNGNKKLPAYKNFKIEPGQKKDIGMLDVVNGYSNDAVDRSVIIDDVVRGSGGAIAQWLSSGHVIIIRPTSTKTYNQKEIDKILDMLGNPPTVLASTLPSAGGATTKYKPKKADAVWIWKGFPTNGGHRRNKQNRNYSRLCWDTKNVDFSKGGVYIPVKKFAIVDRKGEVTYTFDHMLDAAVGLGLIKDVNIPDMYALTDKQIRLAKSESKKWVSVYDYIEDLFIKANKNNMLYITASFVRDEKTRVEIDRWENMFETFYDSTLDTNTLFGKYVERCKMMKTIHRDLRTTDGTNQVWNIARTLGLDIEKHTKKIYNDQVSLWEQIIKQYPMFKIIDWYAAGEHVDVIESYIK